MVLKTHTGSRAVSRASGCSGNKNHSECLLPNLPRWNRLIARLPWEQLTGAEGWLVSIPDQSPCHWMGPRKMPAHPLRLVLALLLSCVSALKKMTIEPDYLVKDYIIRVPMRNCTEERAERMWKTPKLLSHNRVTSLSQAGFLWQKKLKWKVVNHWSSLSHSIDISQNGYKQGTCDYLNLISWTWIS